ncbi:MAG: DUF4139 domain-containing protein [Epsilonproteobacteria bacterium]|nr:DUF4139 domain-containing protein [Campylobacterota bacterium]
MYKKIYLFLTLAVFLFAQTNPLHVRIDIYANTSFITKSFQVNNQENIYLKLPTQANLENITIKAKNCDISDITLSNPKNSENQETKKLILKIENIQNRMISLQETNDMLKTISLKNRKGEDISKTIDYFSKNYMKNTQKLSALKVELKKANERLKMLQNQKAQKHRIFKAHATCKDKEIVQITYPESNFRIMHFYDIKASSTKMTLTLIKKIKIIQKTGENFNNLDIYAHSNAYNQAVAPTPFYPRYLNVIKKRNSLMKKSISMAMDKVAGQTNTIYRENLTTSSFVALRVSIKNNQEKIVKLGKETKNIKFENDIDGYSSSRAYLKVKFTSNRFYQRARAFIYLDNNQVGSKVLPNIKKDSKTDIYFGENQNIKIKKTLQKKFSKNQFFGDTKITTLVWQYKITNNGKILQKINLIERLPISQNEDIKIKPLFDTKNAKINKIGKTIWSFTLAPNKTKIIKFGYEIKRPKE